MIRGVVLDPIKQLFEIQEEQKEATVITFIPLGGAEKIGASAYLFVTEDQKGRHGLLVDVGVSGRFGKEGDEGDDFDREVPMERTSFGELSLPKLPRSSLARFQGKTAQEVILESAGAFIPNVGYLHSLGLKDLCVIVTHSHADHAGAIPMISKLFPDARIFMTPITRDVSLWSWEQYLGFAKAEKLPVLYSRGDIEATKSRITTVFEYEQIDLGLFSISFFPAGHVPGAVSLKLSIRDGKTVSVFVSSDICFHDQNILRGAPLLGNAEIGMIDYVLAEGTYGAKNASTYDEAARSLVSVVLQHLRIGGKVIIPAFQIGRSQEVFAILKRHGIVDQYPVWIDGAARNVAEIYINHGVIDPSVREHFIVDDRHREVIVHSDAPCVVVAPHGMLLGGRSSYFVQAWGGQRNTLVALVSFQEPQTPGARLAQKGRSSMKLTVGTKVVDVSARVVQLPISAHAPGLDIVQMVERLNPAERVFLVHGGKSDLAILKDRVGHKAVVARMGTPYVL
ncbi:MAG: MBL fold metallo-hydrolase [Candidatus Pacebacteria bacterium]|nr:MBL fold metallo-hydrolase [Candidatus Paceibacterota bacterium]